MKTTGVTLLLHQAVASNRLNLVVRLMDIQDYNMHRTNPAGETALHVACKTTNCNAIVEKLVEGSRCDLNAQDQHGNTALHLLFIVHQKVLRKCNVYYRVRGAILKITISESVDSLCRDGTDTPIVCVHRKAFLNHERIKWFTM